MGHGDMDVGMLIELVSIGVQCTENADLNTLFACPAEHGVGGCSE